MLNRDRTIQASTTIQDGTTDKSTELFLHQLQMSNKLELFAATEIGSHPTNFGLTHFMLRPDVPQQEPS